VEARRLDKLLLNFATKASYVPPKVVSIPPTMGKLLEVVLPEIKT
jgi:hypothetical protein